MRGDRQTERAHQLARIREEFYRLCAEPNRQAAGLALEAVLNDLFSFFALAPRPGFRVVGEQIDGSFVLDGEVYLLEAKWEGQALPERPLLEFRGKIEGKSSFTRGVFVALNHVTSQALDAITRGKQPNFVLLNGHHLMLVLEGRLALPALLRAKVRRLAEEGLVYVPATEFLT